MTSENGNERAMVRMRVQTVLGDFAIAASDRGLRSVTPIRAGANKEPEPAASARLPEPGAAEALRHAHAAADALQRYAAGEPVRFEGPLDVAGTAVQRAVWDRLRAIPFGATATYGEIAAALGMPGEARAIAAAVAANPVCILLPCHRVLGADGSLRGFAWGLDLKRRLLAHEGSVALPLFG